MPEGKRNSPERIIEMLKYNPDGHAFRLDPDRHRHLLKVPDIREKFQKLRRGESLYGISYLINKLTKEQAFEIMSNSSIGIDQLLDFQKRRTYLSSDLLVGPDNLIHDRAEWIELSILSGLYNETKLDSSPNTARSFLPLSILSRVAGDEWVNAVLGYKLAEGHFPNLAITEVDSLQTYAESRGGGVAWPDFYSGIANLTGSTAIREITERGLLKDPKNFYSQVGGWLLGVTEKMTFGRKKLRLTALFAYGIRDLPPIDLLPPLARSLCEFLVDIPLNLLEGQVVPPSVLALYVKQFIEFGNRVVHNQQSGRELSSPAMDVIHETNFWLGKAEKLVGEIAKHNKWWDKRTSKQLARIEDFYAPNVRDIIQEIRKAGGKGPKRIRYDLQDQLTGRD